MTSALLSVMGRPDVPDSDTVGVDRNPSRSIAENAEVAIGTLERKAKDNHKFVNEG